MKEQRTRGNATDYNAIDLIELLFFLLRRWVWILLATVVGLVASMVIYSHTVEPTYRADAEIYMTDTGTVINASDLSLTSELSVDYEQILLSRNVLKKVIAELGLDIGYKDLKGRLTLTSPSGSHCLIIEATASTPEEAVAIVNSLVEYGSDQIYRVFGKDQPSVIDAAEADAVYTLVADRKRYALMGALAGMAAVVLPLTLLFMIDTTLKTEEDIERYLGMNVLTVVPDSKEGKKRKKQWKKN